MEAMLNQKNFLILKYLHAFYVRLISFFVKLFFRFYHFYNWGILLKKGGVMDRALITVFLTLFLTFSLVSLVVTVFIPRQKLSRYLAVLFFVCYFVTAHFASPLDYRTILFFVAGFMLLVLEVFIPGFGLPGIMGVVLILVSGAFAIPYRATALGVLLVSVVAAGVAVAVFVARGKETIFSQYALRSVLTSERGYVSSSAKETLVGKTAIARTALRPSGTIVVENVPYSAVTEGIYIERNEEVQIVRAKGNPIVVRRKK